MFFEAGKSLFARLAVVLVLLGGMLGVALNRQALAAPREPLPSSGLRSAPEMQGCVPAWRWISGPSRPDVAQQAELALKNKGVESTVLATEYGETDSCGNFESFSMDFTVTLANPSRRQLSPSSEAGLAEDILAALSLLGQPQLGNVRIDFSSGAVRSYSGLSDPQAALTSPDSQLAPSLNATATWNRKVFLLVYNPVLRNGQDLNAYMGWPAHMTSVQGIINTFLDVSHGQLQYTIAETQVANEWPALVDGFRYTEDSYLAVLRNGALPHDPDMADYDAMIADPQLDLCGKLNRGEIDELWLYGGPYFGFYETRLVGPGAYQFNSPPVGGVHTCNRLLPIMGLNYERGLQEAVHSFGHRTEATMAKVYGGWLQNRTAHNWDRFALVKAQSPAYSYSGCGSIHYPPNGTVQYDYGNPGAIPTNCDDFSNYPDLSDPLTVAVPVTCTAWNCNHLDYLSYWFNHLPAYPQCASDGVENNWWSYFVDPSLALFPSANCPPVPPAPVLPGDTVRVSANAMGGQTVSESAQPSISADGRYVAFESYASNLVRGDTNGAYDIFLRDMLTGSLTRVSVDSSGMQGNGRSQSPSISGDGRYVAFTSAAANLVPGDTNELADIFVHDTQTGLTRRVSVDSAGTQAAGSSDYPFISADGRLVAFMSSAPNLVPSDTLSRPDIFVHDLQTGATAIVSAGLNGLMADNASASPSLSSDGRYVAFHSYATNLVPGDTNAWADIFVTDRLSGVTTRVSVDTNGAQSNNQSYQASISADGRYIVFESYADNLVAGDTNGRVDVFLHDMLTGLTTRVSVNSSGLQGNHVSSDPSISGDGRYIVFYSEASNLAPSDNNGINDILVHNAQTGQTTIASIDSNGVQANRASSYPSITEDGQFIVFQSFASNLVAGDTNGSSDIFVHRQDNLVPTVTPTFTPTNTPTPTSTSTPTPPAPASAGALYLSLTGSQAIGGVASADEDILRFDGTTWSLFFDGSDVGVGSPDLFAFSIVDADTILMSFASNVTVNGIAATPQDVLQFDATSLGSTTAGTFSLYFDGSDVGFDSTTNEKIDSLTRLPDGRLLFSTNGNPSVPGLTTGRDEDMLAFTPTGLGEATSGTWSLYFDGSDVGLSETSGEDIDAFDLVGEDIYLSTQADFSVPGLTGADEDVFVCAAGSVGEITACDYSPTLYFDGSTWGLTANDVDAFHFLASGPVPTGVPTNTPTLTPTAASGPTDTPTNTPTPTATASPTSTPTSTATVLSTGNTFTFTAIADAYVNAGSPTSNYGSSTALRLDASPDLHSYLRFAVQGLSGTVTRATLRVYANSASSLGCTGNAVADDTWMESALNYNSAPPVGAALGSSGSFGANTWIEMDVTGYITGNGSYSLALTTASSTAVSLASRETGVNAPQLVIETMP